jgi:hypothetical protein
MADLEATDVLGRDREQSEMPRPLDGDRQPALMPGAGAGLAPRPDLASLCEKPTQGGHVFVVDRLSLFQAEGAHLATPDETTAGLIATTARAAVAVIVVIIVVAIAASPTTFIVTHCL